MNTYRIDRDGFVTERATGKDLGMVQRSERVEHDPNFPGTGRTITCWIAEDQYGRRGNTLWHTSRKEAAEYLCHRNGVNL